jgi:hypothetical protein
VSVNGQAQLLAGGPLEVVTPDRTVYLPSLARLLLSAQQRRERSRLLLGRYFLVNMRLGEIGEVFRCRRCNGKHDRLTRLCVERPFSGLMGGLYAFVHTLAPAAEIGALAPEVQARASRIAALFQSDDLADRHPDLARKLASFDAPAGGADLDVGMLSLGLLERIEPKDAQRLLDRINTRAALYREPLLVVPGLNTRWR